MKKILSILCCMAMAISLVGCGGNGATTGKTVTVAKENDVISMDSTYATDGMSFEVIHAIIDGLMTQDSDGSLINALAADYTVSDDELTWTFTLKDAVWSNGDAVTAHDFEYAWKRTVVRPEAEYAYLYGSDGACIAGADEILDRVWEGETLTEADATDLGVKALDDKTLEIKLAQSVPFFASLMTFPIFYPVNQAFAEELGDQYALSPDNLLSCGAFKLTKWEQGNRIELVKNDTYYDADKVEIDNLIFVITKEVSSSVAAFEGGTVDFTKLSSDLIDKYKDADEFTTVLEGYLWYLQYNMENQYLSNKNLRLALTYAVDKVDLVENVLKDGSLTGDGFTPSGLATGPTGKDFREEAGEYYSLDATKAQEYFAAALQELGLTSLKLTLLYENADPAKSAAEYLQSCLQKNLPGLTIEMDMQPKANRIERQKVGEFEVVLTRWGPDYADPTTYLTLMQTGNSYNYGKFSSAAYDGKLAEASKAATVEARWAALIEAEKILMEEVPITSVFQVGGASLISGDVTGIDTHAVGVPYIYKNVKKN